MRVLNLSVAGLMTRLALAIEVGERFSRFERWVLDRGPNPLVTAFAIIFGLMALGALPWRRPWRRSIQAWFVFCCTQLVLWGWFTNAAYGWWVWPIEQQAHILFGLIVAGIPACLWVGWTMTGRYLFGTEDTR